MVEKKHSVTSHLTTIKSTVITENATFLRKNFYRFMIDYSFIKNKNDNLHKELIEFMFHPDRVRRLGGLDYIEQLD